jgi:uncharacterized membrane protein
MATSPQAMQSRPGYAILFTTAVPLLLGTLLSDWAYSRTEVVQWTNFASWLNAGALVIIALALAWTLFGLVRAGLSHRRTRAMYAILAAAVFVLGFINALVHAKDAFAAMPAGLILSLIVFLLALAAVWAGLSSSNKGARA